MAERRVDPVLGTVVHVVDARRDRPHLPSAGCPFCAGVREAPEPDDVRWFPNRWPAMDGARCEVNLYTPDHDPSLSSLGTTDVRRVVDLWAERTDVLGARADVADVLAFENRVPRSARYIAAAEIASDEYFDPVVPEDLAERLRAAA